MMNQNLMSGNLNRLNILMMYALNPIAKNKITAGNITAHHEQALFILYGTNKQDCSYKYSLSFTINPRLCGLMVIIKPVANYFHPAISLLLSIVP
ncbi:hypothetical protein OA40_08395 [Morganella morganii]|nr:hypothetical protein OA40_08395 [Morganella morganii]KNZ85193.1 hypothetical protein AKG16_16955 [Morganella morganii]